MFIVWKAFLSLESLKLPMASGGAISISRYFNNISWYFNIFLGTLTVFYISKYLADDIISSSSVI